MPLLGGWTLELPPSTPDGGESSVALSGGAGFWNCPPLDSGIAPHPRWGKNRVMRAQLPLLGAGTLGLSPPPPQFPPLGNELPHPPRGWGGWKGVSGLHYCVQGEENHSGLDYWLQVGGSKWTELVAGGEIRLNHCFLGGRVDWPIALPGEESGLAYSLDGGEQWSAHLLPCMAGGSASFGTWTGSSVRGGSGQAHWSLA